MKAEGFFSRRWRGDLPVATLWWRDMLAIGTAINLFVSVLALMLLAQGVRPGAAVALHFAPAPYNLFLLVALLRHPHRSTPLSMLGVAWFAAMLLI